MHNPSGNVWRCGFGTLNFGGNNTTFRWFKTSFSLPVWDSVSWWILVPNIRMRIPMSSQVNWSIGRVHQFSKKKLRKFCLQLTEKNPMNRNGVEMFVCFVIEVSQQHLPIWAQWCPVRGSPGGTRIYWASSMTWERPGDHRSSNMAMGKMGEIMEVPKKINRVMPCSWGWW